jgi:hypothetical protein
MVLLSLMHKHLPSPGIFAVITTTLLPLLRLQCCHCQAGVIALVMIALSLLSMHRHFCHCHNGLLPSLRWRHCQHCMGIVALVAPGLLSLLC